MARFRSRCRPVTAGERRARLGLYVSGRIVEAHGGRISVIAGEQGRTRFVFTMPADVAPG